MEVQQCPYNVTILGFDQALSSAITGAMDLFALAGVSWNRIQQQNVKPRFKVELATAHGQPITCTNQLVLTPHRAIEEVEKTDILLIPTIGGDISRVLNENKNLSIHIKRLHQFDADIASNCTGAFLLAQSSLLDGKTATTHWGYAREFCERFPKVNLQPNKILTQDERLFCAGGGLAWTQLVMVLIERYCGHQVVSEMARSHVMDINLRHNPIYTGSRHSKNHQDKPIIDAQEFIDNNFALRIDIDKLASIANMTNRTFARRFKKASGQTPVNYIQQIRIEQARKLLETQSWTVDTIVQKVGYDDVSTFSRLFKKYTQYSPSQYRIKYSKQ